MKPVMKTMIVLAVLSLSLGVIAGCKGKSEEEKKKDLVGTYVNKDDSSEYFVLEKDGTYHYHHEKFGYDLTGNWEVKGNKLIVSFPTTGPMPPSKIEGNKIIGDDGSVHIKVKERSPVSLEPASIPGEYVDKFGSEKNKVLKIYKDGTFEHKGESFLRGGGESILKGIWQANDNKIEFYAYVGQQKVPAISLSGEIKGDTIYSAGGAIWRKQEEVKEINKEKTAPYKKISKDRIAGRYVIEALKNDGTVERPPGVTILQEDGSIRLESAGLESVVADTKWEFRDGLVQIYPYGSDGAGERLTGEVKGDTITFRLEEGEVRYIREGGKTLSSVKQISKGDLPPSLPYGQEKDFVQPCSDSGGYYGWLAGPNKDHLGHDYNASVGTKVKAISDGNVWDTYSNISGFGSEGKPGPAIWIKHRLANGKYFYALYGHIKPGSDILKGAKVKAGQIIGTVIEYRDKISKEDISHLHLGIWNRESDPPLLKMGYGPTRDFTDPIKFLQENKPYVKEEPQQTVDPGGKCRIAVIPKGTVHIFWKSIHAGAVKAEQELKDLGVEVIWKGPLKEDDRESQIRVMEGFITSGVSGIVLAPQDDEALRGSVEEAVGSGIPVVIIDSDLKSEKYVSFVATDNYIGGRKGGKRLAEILGGKGKVVMLRYQVGSASTTNREKGFMDVLKEEYPQIQVVSANQYGGATTESAYKASENLLAPLRTPDGGLTIDGIFCPNESTTFGMLRALQDSHLAGKVKYVGFDNSESLVQPLRNGHIHGLVLQDPINMGYLGVKTMFEHLQGKKVEKRIDTGSEVATPENMNDPRIRSLLAPDFRKVLTNSN